MSRNNLEAFYTCCQRETDFSKTIRTKHLWLTAKSKAKTAYHRRLEKQFKVNFSSFTTENLAFWRSICSPEFKQNGKLTR